MKSELPESLPDAKRYLPDWTERRFVVVDRTGRWASAISAEANGHLDSDTAVLTFQSCESAREAADFWELRNTIGFVLFLEGMERECLGFLGRLGRSNYHREILVVATENHREILPVIMEAGVESILFDVSDDVPVAEWCRRAAARRIR